MKKNRREKLLEIIAVNSIGTQDELADFLRKAGYPVTQATVSRDIKELNLTKVTGPDKRPRYAVLQLESRGLGEKYVRVLREGMISIQESANLLVIKTVSGMAMAVAAALDAMDWNEIVGCIAGDDTIMCAIRTVDDTFKVMDKLKRIIQR